jgi:hypothetical protein
MEVLDWIAAWPGAAFIRDSGTAYLFVNAAHILGIALLVGSILPLDLRLIGFFRSVSLTEVGPFLIRVAAAGLSIAILTGLWLFSVKPAEYVANSAFLTKAALLVLALGNVILQHRGRNLGLAFEAGEIPLGVRVIAAASAVLWLSVLVAGRWIGFL